MSELSISNIVTVSLALAGAGAGVYNTSNIALFTPEHHEVSFGTDGFKIYKSVTEIGKDFGTSSETYKESLAVFSQKPNILGANGYLVIIPLITEIQTLTFDDIAASGDFEVNFDGAGPSLIAWDDTASAIQAKLRLLAGMEKALVTGSIASQTLTIALEGYEGPAPLMTITNDNLLTGAAGAIVTTVTEIVDGETLGEAITRTDSLVQYFGVMSSFIPSQVDMLAAAAIVQVLNKMAFFVSRTAVDVDPGGILDLLRSNSYDKSRGLYYGGGTLSDSLAMMAAYASRALSTNFSGSNTTQTMHLKDLTGVIADTTMTESLLTKAKAAGVDTYISIQGVAKVFCTKGNTFFDRVFNREWFVGRITIDGFNVLAQTSTKVAQTDAGVSSLVGAYRKVCEQAVVNQFLAPGTWNSPDTFGVQADFFNNITERGYYIYSAPLAAQSPTDRSDRKAPVAQIAIKEAGSIHSAAIIVNINA